MKKNTNVARLDINLRALIDDEKCYQTIRDLRWPGGVTCPTCQSERIVKNGRDVDHPARQKYRCNTCRAYFDDLTGTLFSGHHQPLSVWILCLYFMGLNLSNRQIACELGIGQGSVQVITRYLRTYVAEKKPTVTLEGEVECDEVYIVAGHKGNPEAVKKTTKTSS